jgi:hypothetical protein
LEASSWSCLPRSIAILQVVVGLRVYAGATRWLGLALLCALGGLWLGLSMLGGFAAPIATASIAINIAAVASTLVALSAA